MKTSPFFLITFLTLCAVGMMKAQNSITTVTTEAELQAAMQTNNAQILFGGNISITSLLEIKDSRTITIDLNGFALDRGCTSRGSQVIVVRSGSTLNLSNGTLTGGWGGNGGALDIETNTTVNLTDVIISGNKADDRGGGISNHGTLTMTGGSISGNISNDQTHPRGGGGIFNYYGATATLTGVNITGNEAAVYGGGGICNFGTLTIYGCTITSNTAVTHGGGIWQEGMLNMQGAVTVDDNVKTNGLRSNLYLKNGSVVTVTGALTGSDVSVGMETLGTFTSNYSTYHSGVHPADFFYVDQLNITSIALVDGEGKLSRDIPEGGIYYVERSWNDGTKAVEALFRTLESTEYTTLTGSDDQANLGPGYYVVKGGNVEYDKSIIFDGGGEHHLILCDGAQISAMYFIVPLGNTLSIYGQVDGSGIMVNTYSQASYADAGLGGSYSYGGHAGPIIIHGGTIDVTGSPRAAGIGGGRGGDCTSVTIYGGTIRAEGRDYTDGIGGAGIGGGAMGGKGGVITIYGGTVTAYARSIGEAIHDSGGAGIGGGPEGDGGIITIYGGSVNATGDTGAGIGGGYNGNGATVAIHGGTVTARCNLDSGAGIGTGYDAGGIDYTGQLTVTGGKVYAYGGIRGAGIGGGWDTSGSDVTITGGYVYAEGGQYAAGIGSGVEALTSGGKQGGRLTVTGGYVEAHGGEDAAGIGGGEDADGSTVTISGGEVHAYGSYGGAGIGGGEEGDGGNVTITGGTVVAHAGRNETGHRAIGPGKGSDEYGQLTLGDQMMVRFKSGSDWSVPVDVSSNPPYGRKAGAWFHTEARIEPCTHPGATYTDSGSSVNVGCNYCLSVTMPYTFNANGNWNDESKWISNLMPHEGNNVAVKADATIPANCCANVGNVAIDGGSITIADGGQLIHANEGVTARVNKMYGAYTGNGGYYLIANPLANEKSPDALGLLENDYDLYRFNQSAELEWENWKQEGDHFHFNLVNGAGYLYATDTDNNLAITGILKPALTDVSVPLAYDENADFKGFNLVGNPFVCDAYLADGRDFYVLNDDGDEVVPATNLAIPRMQGIFVQAANAEDHSVTFTCYEPTLGSALTMSLTQSQGSRGTTTIDNVRIRFGEGRGLEKFQLDPSHSKLYIPQEGKDYAVVSVGGVGRDGVHTVSTEVPVNFKATKDGEYTLSFNLENVEMAYLHLIDNKTGTDIDLLSAGNCGSESAMTTEGASYTFTAKTTDFASRFRLMFAAAADADGTPANPVFAFISNGEIVVNGIGTLQVVDVLGRVFISKDLSTLNSKLSTLNFKSGVYVLRLVNGENVRTQKIIID